MLFLQTRIGVSALHNFYFNIDLGEIGLVCPKAVNWQSEVINNFLKK